MENIVVLTPTYNRANMLPKLYESLKSQSDLSFKWIIIDDGSEDNTKLIIEKMINEGCIEIEYVYQRNGGKGRALNKGFSLYDDISVYVIVDSDDYLISTGIETVRSYLIKYAERTDIGAFFFHYVTPDGNVLKPTGKPIDQDYIMTQYEYNSKFGKNDGCFCYLGNSVKKYKYPEFKGETYIGPTVIQMEMAGEYNIVYSPKIIGVAEYQEGGLTKSGRELRLKNPLGMIHYSKLMMSKKSKFITQLKYAISIWPYVKKAKIAYSNIIRETGRPLLLTFTFLPGYLLAWYWEKKMNNKCHNN